MYLVKFVASGFVEVAIEVAEKSPPDPSWYRWEFEVGDLKLVLQIVPV